MKFLTDPIINTSKELAALSTRVFDGSVAFLKSTWNSIPLFAGTKAHLGLDGVDEDQTHYFLIPFRAAESGYALGTARVLPEGVGPDNDLPKRKIFHIPAAGGEEALKDLLRDQIAAEKLAEADATSETAEWLEKISAEIDEKSTMVTGGIILIGGVVAIANPAAGVAIAGKALLPSIGLMFSREGFKGLANKFRRRQEEKVGENAEKEASKEVKSMKPQVKENGLLALLEKAVKAPEGSFDPALESMELPVDVEHMQTYAMTSEAVLHAYDDILGSKRKEEESKLDAVTINWIRSLEQYLED